MHQQFPRRAPSAATFSRWAQGGRLPRQRTLGGHRRSPAALTHQLAASPVQEVRAA